MLYFGFYLIFIVTQNIMQIFFKVPKDLSNRVFILFTFKSSVGFPMALIRISEPYVWEEFKKVMQPIFCCQKQQTEIWKQPKFSNESLYSFVTSAMNVEYVCVILVGIGKSGGK